MTSLRLEQSPSVPLGAVRFSLDGAEVGPDQFGLLPSLLALASPSAQLFASWKWVSVFRDSQSLELNLNVLGRAALVQSLGAVLIFVAQDIALFDETFRKFCRADMGVPPGTCALAVLPALSRRAAAALGAAAQAALVRVQRVALAGLTGPVAASGGPKDFERPGRGCNEKSTFPSLVTQRLYSVQFLIHRVRELTP